MASACICCVHHVRSCCCSYAKGTSSWSKSLRNVPKIDLGTCSDWLNRGGKKNAGEKSYKFFREGDVYDIFATAESGDFHVKARCYRSLRKSEDPHYLVVALRESEDSRATVHRAHCSCKGGSGGHCNHIFAFSTE